MNKNYTEVVIAGKTYTLGGYEDVEYLQRIAAYINTKRGELRTIEGFSRQSADYQNVMLQLNLADDYYKAKNRVSRLEARLESMEKEVYQLKHELVTSQIRYEQQKKDE